MQTNDEIKDRAKKYADLRVSGTPARQAANIVGYSEKTTISQIERVGGEVRAAMQRALEEKGLTIDKIASEYVDGIEKSKTNRDGDYQAHAKYLLQLGYLHGLGEKTPAVAVQINNNSGDASPDEPVRIETTLREITDILGNIKDALDARGTGGVHAECIETGDSEAHPGVAEPTATGEEVVGGGQP